MNILELIERTANELRDDECWTLDRIPHENGYVYVQNRRLHRVAWEAHNAEPIPEGMVVMHSCDNRECFNPAHLSVGTQKQNVGDAIEKGRFTQKGSIPEFDKDAIVSLLDEGLTQKEVARRMNCCIRTVIRAKQARKAA